MAKAIRQIQPPFKGVVFDIRRRPNYLAVVVHESNIMEFNESKRMQIMDYLLKIRAMIQNFGVRCEIEGIPYGK